jgi:glycerate kinase
MGKLPLGILRRARSHGVPVALTAGRVADRDALLAAGFSHVECINPPGISLEEAIRPETAKKNLMHTIPVLFSQI